MKNHVYILLIAPLLFFSSCEEEEVTMNNNFVYTEFEINNGEGIFLNVMTQAGSESFTVNSNNFLFTTKTFSATALSGTTFYYMMQLYNYDANSFSGCIDVNARTYHNNNLYENRNYSIGYIEGLGTCQHSTGIAEMYGIIAN